MQYLSYLQIYASMFIAVLLYFFPGLLSYKDFVTILGAISGITVLVAFTRLKEGKGQVAKVVFANLLLIILYYITRYFYPFMDSRYTSFFLVIAGQLFPVTVLAAISANRSDDIYKIKRLAPVVGLVFTTIAFIAAFKPTSTTSAGYVLNENGLNYQSTSYLAAYAASFLSYYVVSFSHMDWGPILNKKVFRNISLLSICLNLFSILICGGRGGLVVYVLVIIWAYYENIREPSTKDKTLKNILILSGIVLCSVFAVQYAENSTLSTNGFERILATVQEGDQNGRDVLRVLAIRSFSESPIWGHGIGSVFQEVGHYSHNCFTDVLVEGGGIGFLIFLSLIISSVKKGLYLSRYDITDSLWIFFFIDGFGMSLFSGYYLANLPMYWAMTFMLSYHCRDYSGYKLLNV